MRLISIAKLALQVMHKGSTIGMQIYAHLGRLGSAIENNYWSNYRMQGHFLKSEAARRLGSCIEGLGNERGI